MIGETFKSPRGETWLCVKEVASEGAEKIYQFKLLDHGKKHRGSWRRRIGYLGIFGEKFVRIYWKKVSS